MAFWQGVLLLSVIGAVFILWPLFRLPITRKLAVKPVRRDVTQAALYKEHLADIDRSLANGDIDQTQYELLKTELQRTLISESDGLAPTERVAGGQLVLFAMAILVPVITFVLYTQWGAKPDWDIYTLMQAEREQPAESAEEFEKASRELLLKVQARLKQQPENHQIRYLLAERSMAIKDYDQAIDAYKKLLVAEPGSPSMSIKLAQALFVREGNKVTPEVIHHTNTAVKGAPFMYQALEMGGMVAFHQGKYRDAVTYWNRAKSQLDPGSRSAMALDGAIRKAARAAIAAGDSLEPDANKSKPEATVASQNEKPTGETVQGETMQEGDVPGFAVSVSLADGVNASPNDTVFVYARAWQGAKMPLAIQRITVSQLPVTIKLDNSMAMAPGMDMSSAPELELLARVSKSGSPVPQPGDWQASIGPVSLGEGTMPYNLAIADQVP